MIVVQVNMMIVFLELFFLIVDPLKDLSKIKWFFLVLTICIFWIEVWINVCVCVYKYKL